MAKVKVLLYYRHPVVRTCIAVHIVFTMYLKGGMFKHWKEK